MTAFRPTNILPDIITLGSFREAVEATIAEIEPYVFLPEDKVARAAFMPAITALARHMCICIRMIYSQIKPMSRPLRMISYSALGVVRDSTESRIRLSESQPYITVVDASQPLHPGDIPRWGCRTARYGTSTLLDVDPVTETPIRLEHEHGRAIHVRSIPLPWILSPSSGEFAQYRLPYEIIVEDTSERGGDDAENDPHTIVDSTSLFDSHFFCIRQTEAARAARVFATGELDANEDEIQVHCQSISDMTQLMAFVASAVVDEHGPVEPE